MRHREAAHAQYRQPSKHATSIPSKAPGHASSTHTRNCTHAQLCAPHTQLHTRATARTRNYTRATLCTARAITTWHSPPHATAMTTTPRTSKTREQWASASRRPRGICISHDLPFTLSRPHTPSPTSTVASERHGERLVLQQPSVPLASWRAPGPAATLCAPRVVLHSTSCCTWGQLEIKPEINSEITLHECQWHP